MASYTSPSKPIILVPKAGPDQGLWLNLEAYSMQAGTSSGYFLDSEHYNLLRSATSPLLPYLPRTTRRSDNSEVHYQLFENEGDGTTHAGDERCSTSRPIHERGLATSQIRDLEKAVIDFKSQHGDIFHSFTLPSYAASPECYRVDAKGRLLILWGVRKSGSATGISAQILVDSLMNDENKLAQRHKKAGSSGLRWLWWLLPLLLLLLLLAFLAKSCMNDAKEGAKPVAVAVNPDKKVDSQQFLTVSSSPASGIAPVLISAKASKPGTLSIGALSKTVAAEEWLDAPAISTPGRVTVEWRPEDPNLNKESKDVEVFAASGGSDVEPPPAVDFGIQILESSPSPLKGLGRVRMVAVHKPETETLSDYRWKAFYDSKMRVEIQDDREAIFDGSPGNWRIEVTAKTPDGRVLKAERDIVLNADGPPKHLQVQTDPADPRAPVTIQAKADLPGKIVIGDYEKQAAADEWVTAPKVTKPGTVRVEWIPEDTSLTKETKVIAVKEPIPPPPTQHLQVQTDPADPIAPVTIQAKADKPGKIVIGDYEKQAVADEWVTAPKVTEPSTVRVEWIPEDPALSSEALDIVVKADGPSKHLQVQTDPADPIAPVTIQAKADKPGKIVIGDYEKQAVADEWVTAPKVTEPSTVRVEWIPEDPALSSEALDIVVKADGPSKHLQVQTDPADPIAPVTIQAKADKPGKIVIGDYEKQTVADEWVTAPKVTEPSTVRVEWIPEDPALSSEALDIVVKADGPSKHLQVQTDPADPIAPVTIQAKADKPGKIVIGDYEKQAVADEWVTAPKVTEPSTVRVEWIPEDPALSSEALDIVVKADGPSKHLQVQTDPADPIAPVTIQAKADKPGKIVIGDYEKQTVADEWVTAPKVTEPSTVRVEWIPEDPALSSEALDIVVKADGPSKHLQVQTDPADPIAPVTIQAKADKPGKIVIGDYEKQTVADEWVTAPKVTEPSTVRVEWIPEDPALSSEALDIVVKADGPSKHLQVQTDPADPIAPVTIQAKADKPGKIVIGDYEKQAVADEWVTAPKETEPGPVIIEWIPDDTSLTKETKEIVVKKPPVPPVVTPQPLPIGTTKHLVVETDPKVPTIPMTIQAKADMPGTIYIEDHRQQAAADEWVKAPEVTKPGKILVEWWPEDRSIARESVEITVGERQQSGLSPGPGSDVNDGIQWSGPSVVNPDGTITFTVKGTQTINGESSTILGGRLFVGNEREARKPREDGSFEITLPAKSVDPVQVIGETSDGVSRIRFELNPSSTTR